MDLATTATIRHQYWRYYLVLENDVLSVEPYVSFHPDNYNCFSNQFIKLYQIVCSEVDVVCKAYCHYIAYKDGLVGKCTNMVEYAKYVVEKHPEITRQEVVVSGTTCTLVPWEKWSHAGYAPAWWRKYNKVKHERSSLEQNGSKYNYQNANLGNVLTALAALYVLEKYFYADVARSEAPLGTTPITVLAPHSQLFDLLDLDTRALALCH